MAGTRGVALIQTGGRGYDHLIIVTESENFRCVAVAAMTGVEHSTLFLAGGLDGNYAAVVAVSESGYPSFNVAVTAVAGVGGISPILTGGGSNDLLVRMSQRIDSHRYS